MKNPSPNLQRKLYRVNVVRYDADLRFIVPSRRPGEAPYLVELDAYGGNGQCICAHFQMKLEPLLKLGLTVDQGLAKGLKIPEWGTAEDLYRCFHCHVARLKMADMRIAAIIRKKELTEGSKGRT